MRLRHFAVVVIAAVLSVTVTGQCPRQKAERVGHKIEYSGSQSCDGLELELPGISLGHEAQGCPLFAFFTPPHDTSVASSQETQTVQIGSTPALLLSFKCEKTLLFFLELSSTCKVDRIITSTAFPLLRTDPCTPLQQPLRQ